MGGVSDRIMDDVYARYDPSKVVNGNGSRVRGSGDGPHGCFPPEVDATTTTSSSDILREVDEHRQHLLESFQRGDYVAMGILRLLEGEKELADEGEWRRLQMALLKDKGGDNISDST
jgi:hypothetical protein